MTFHRKNILNNLPKRKTNTSLKTVPQNRKKSGPQTINTSVARQYLILHFMVMFVYISHLKICSIYLQGPSLKECERCWKYRDLQVNTYHYKFSLKCIFQEYYRNTDTNKPTTREHWNLMGPPNCSTAHLWENATQCCQGLAKTGMRDWCSGVSRAVFNSKLIANI